MEGIAQLVLGAGVTAGFHPIAYSKVLIQLGYEPVGPEQTTSIFGRKVLCYPNVFKYLGNIRKQDGFFGMYRGLGARLAGGIVGTYVTGAVSVQLRGGANKLSLPPKDDEVDGDEETAMAGFQRMCKDTSIEMIARCSGTIVSQPFHVIMVRSMAQFIGGEDKYNSLFSSIGEIYRQDGILGFFSGLIPRLLGEVITIWLANSLAYVINTYLIPKTKEAASMKSYTGAVCSLMVTQVTYPFNLVANMMAVNGSGLAGGQPPITPVFDGWLDCWQNLSKDNNLKRGSSLFFRYYKGPTVLRYDGTLVPSKAAFS